MKGPMLPLLHELADAYPEYCFGVIKVTKMAARLSNRFHRGGHEHNLLMKRVREVSEYAHIAGAVSMPGWMEGGEPKRGMSEARAVPKHYLAMIRAMRAGLKHSRLPWLISQIEFGKRRVRNMEEFKAVHAGLLKVGKSVDDAIVIPSKGLQLIDDHHFSKEGNSQWAKRAIKAIGELKVMERAVKAAADLEYRSAGPSEMKSNHKPADVLAIVEAKVTKHTPAPSLKGMGTYRDCLLITEWRIRKVVKGKVSGDRLLVVHFGVRDRKYTETAELKSGQRLRLKLASWDPQDKYKNLMMQDDIGDYDAKRYFALHASPVK